MVEQLNAFCYALDLPIAFTNFASLFKMKYKHEYPFSEFLFHLWRMNGVHVLDGFPCFLTTSHTEADVQFLFINQGESVQDVRAYLQSAKLSLMSASSVVLPPRSMATWVRRFQASFAMNPS